MTDPDDPTVAAYAAGLAGVPVWFFHGAADDVVSAEESRLMCEVLRERGADVHLTIYPGVGHAAWLQAYGESGLWDWLAERLR